ncbi:imidazole glycerol phosphate synthase subunit HisF [Permianibacter aggregans]|uniref:Imidazole glycerol phosphate synthase subunit HisF n=1 Tax=Permianibacter aggregans TaxID=1510150 RepID=A0A4R6UL04_9GAMM|nr:imidazole glycerol phosphate synthase subunit HisF [Permianibacter aggregans]QGX41202.1 imidazole glycerol phosphate synthase subunit HisF [Permianibacter aggregans]TDQ45805.1 imidazole glycerol phosphate synthase subunit HisF [Permianibacter aggregans]
MNGLLKRIIPCLDMKDGRVVKGVKFVDLQDLGDPVALAYRYQQQGADEIVLLDISASPEGKRTQLDIVRQVARTLSIPFTVGGGIRELDDIYALLDAGADKVSINSAALKQPELIDQSAKQFGSQCIVVAIDFRLPEQSHFEVLSHGGRTPTGKNAAQWGHEVAERGAGELLLTCIDRDGTGEGFELALTAELARTMRIPVIASGGAKTSAHFVEAFQQGVDAALAAGIFHRGELDIRELKAELRNSGIAVRTEI